MKKINQLSVLLVCGFCVVTGDIMVYVQETHRQIEVEFRDMSSTFGSAIPPTGIRAFVVYASPPTACQSIAPPPNVTNFTGKWAVLIRRNDCNFEKKIRIAQAASYDIAIVHNVNSSDLMRMQASNPEGIEIPSVFVGSATGLFIRDNYQYNEGFYIVVNDDSPFDIGTHLLLPFAVVVAICFSALIGFMVVKCIKDHRRARRHRLPNSSLKRIPTTKYKKEYPYETCAICLDDFVEGEKLRLLPCSHAYHCKCIDPWLTRSKRVCPMCKRKVFAEDERVPTDSESGSDMEDDNTPLLRGNRNNNTGGGTFTNVDLRAALSSVDNLRRLATAFESSNTAGATGEAAGPSQAVNADDSSSADSISFHSDDSSSIFQPPPSVIVLTNDADPTFSIDLSPPPPGGPHSIQASADVETHPSLAEDC